MAVEPVKKITVIAHKDNQNQVVDALTRIGTVDVERVSEPDVLPAKELTEEEVQASRMCSFGISQIEFLLGFLKEYQREKSGFISTMIKDKYSMTTDKFMLSWERVDLDRIYKECSDLEQRLIDQRERKERLRQESNELENWISLGVPLDEVRGGATFGVMPVRVAGSDIEALTGELGAGAPESELEVVGEVGRNVNCLLIYHLGAEEEITSVLSGYSHDTVSLPGSPLEPDRWLEQVSGELEEIEREHEEVLDQVEGYREHIGALEVLKEYLVNQRTKVETMTSFGNTRSTVVVEGWATEEGIEKTRERMRKLSDEIEVEASEPEEGDSPPVSLRNRKWIKPFEFLTRLYGVPNNREYDPTWLIAISFMVFFGFCIGDVGYGLVILIAFLLMRKYMPLGENTKNLLLVMCYGAACAMVAGVITGSYFGIETDTLPQFLQSLVLFKPLEDPLPLMGVCMGLGLIHMLAGTVVEFHDNWKAGSVADALIDQGLVLFLFIGTITAAVLVIAGVVPVMVIVAVAGTALLGMIVLLGHGAKSTPGKVFGGLYETYNTLVGWLGDTVSYVRLFALGLATFVIGSVINTMSGMVRGMAPVIGILIMLLVLVVGHTFNVVINLLGAFVHPLRLEYVEFFSKFYEDGGRDFKPLQIESKTVIIEDKGSS
ncbi:MAG: V-type ATP synthase subunit I [Actinobacteria bacterium]|nr:V-type ATP synthase subunit I [Actinomycetota bacterium]MCG2817723.1 V-type ATP synthase subunit I [Actinomycetes bacterium]MBU4217574.1 V-type ATP synthase subunit I [Actinomycetota bacterium]MBU4358099.1 V-type ATP synthase subunit I [Actinomycetota bacterium]MBU4391782.1 V-type ATP synthase subunit I [Actinomycetota bacterium]